MAIMASVKPRKKFTNKLHSNCLLVLSDIEFKLKFLYKNVY